MRTARFVACTGFAATVALFGGIGCSSSNSTPTSNDYDDVAQSTAALVATPGGGGEIGSMSSAASLAIGVTPSNVTVSASGSFSTVSAGVTYSLTLTCTSASGATLPTCGPTTNDAQAAVSWSGNLTLPDYTATVNRSGSWTLSGVQSGTATFSGSGSFTYASQFQSSFRNEQANLNLSYQATYNAVTYLETAHLVTGGSVHYAIDASANASSVSGSSNRSFTMDAVLTFGASGGATLTLDASHTYMIAASGSVTKI